MEDLGRAQQRLGGDAPPVEADAAQILTLDDRGLQAELRRADRRDIAAGARAENNDVVSVNHDILLERTRSEEHTSELQSLMRISYAVFCLKKKKKTTKTT